MNETNAWENEFTVTWYGRIGPNFSNDQFFILLEKNYTYRIFVHSNNSKRVLPERLVADLAGTNRATKLLKSAQISTNTGRFRLQALNLSANKTPQEI